MSMLQFIRHAGRYREILSVLVGFGFREFFDQAKLDLLLAKSSRIIHRKPRPETEHLRRPARLRLALEALGPTFIKLGQVLSTRPDVLGPEYIAELQKLQDDVPHVPWPKIEAQLRADLGNLDELFDHIEEVPLAAASMAQAHRAKLKDGTEIILKVLRPGIDKTVNQDMEILTAVAAWVAEHVDDLPFDPVAVVKNFSEAMRYELDLEHEGRNTDLFRSNLEPDEEAWFPEVHWDVTRKRVLGLEEIKGTILSHWREAGLSEVERRKLVRAGAYTVLRQVLEKGFFHADPHPGNLFAMPDGRLCFIDCGMAGRVDKETVTDLANLIHGVADGDIDRVYESFLALGRVDETAVDDRALRRDLQEFLDQFTSKAFSEIDMSAVLTAFTEGLRKHRLQCPGDIVMMIKALTTIEGVAEDLDPSFDLITFARPHVEKLIKRQYALPEIKRRLRNNAISWVKLAEILPTRVRTFMDRLLHNKTRVTIDVDGLGTMEHTIHHASRQISYSMLIAAMIMASAILVLAAGEDGAALKTVGFIGFIISFSLAGLILGENLIHRVRVDWRKKKRR
ncbi:MAG: AarF/UbiB family protein [Phycisphaerales bacterium]|nr:AarF/UbiB family protein [Phycisphaerales bacterium]